MKTSRLLKAEIIILALVAILWAVDLKTDCVPRAAVGALRQVVKVAPNSGSAYNMLGNTYQSMNCCEQASEAFGRANEIEETKAKQEALEFRSKDPNAYVAVGDEHCDANDYKAAVTYYRKAVELDPDWSWGHLRLALTYNDLGLYQDAIVKWRRLIELEPEIAVFHAFLADAYLELGQYEEVVVACEEGLRIDPSNAKSHYNLGRAYLEMGDKDLAVEEYRTLKELDEELAEKLHELIIDRSMESK